MTADNICHRYFHLKELKDMLLQSELVSEIAKDDEAINENINIVSISTIICEYIGLTKWDSNAKDKNIVIRHSNDGEIEYAILKHENMLWRDTILMNEWIGLNKNKLIHRYVLKWYALIYFYDKI